MDARMRRAILASAVAGLVALGACGCASTVPFSTSSLKRLRVPTSAAGVQQLCHTVGVSAVHCADAMNALKKAGLP